MPVEFVDTLPGRPLNETKYWTLELQDALVARPNTWGIVRECPDPITASNYGTYLRQWLKRRTLSDAFEVARRGNVVYARSLSSSPRQ